MSEQLLFIASAFPPIVGGSAHVYASLCQRLGSQVCVITAKKSYVDGRELPGWKDWDSRQSFEVRRLDLLRPQYREKPATVFHSAARFLFEDRLLERKLIEEAGFVIRKRGVKVVCLGELYSLHRVGQALRKRFGVGIIHYVHGEELTTGCSSRRYAHGAYEALARATRVIAVSSFTAQEVVRRCRVKRENLKVIHNGVDVGRFYPGPKNESIINRHGLHGRKILLTVARLEPRKGHHAVIRALPEVLKEIPNLSYLIVGVGSQLEALRALALQCNVANQVVFATDVRSEELPGYYRTADLFVMPNRTMPDGDTEGFGLVFLEAGACRKPVIGGNAGGVPDAVEHGVNGLLVDGASPSSVAAACLKVLEDPALAERLASAGLARARASTWDRKTEEFRAVYQEASCPAPLR